MNWYWLILALSALVGSGYLIGYAYRPQLFGADPDWFWGGDPSQVGWVESQPDGTFTEMFYPEKDHEQP